MKKTITLFISGLFLFTGCKDLFEPELVNNRQLENAYDDPIFAQGIIINGYARIPTDAWIWSDLATDNAVSQSTTNDFFLIASGEWAANRNPLSEWNRCLMGIQFMNMSLSVTDSVSYSRHPGTNQMFRDRLKGEAYGLRALFMYHLLQGHAGLVGSELLGVPIIEGIQDKDSEFNLPRPTFEACIQQLYADVDRAISYLPDDYYDRADESQIPQKYIDLGVDAGEYNRAFGNSSKQLMSGRIAKAIRVQAALLAASPAFSQGNSTTWEQVANYAGEILTTNNGVAGIDPQGVTWYANASVIDNLGGGNNPAEILWRGTIGGLTTTLEAQNFPPSLFGQGLVNPTQNLVDAFPMINGYPISDPASNYDPNNPYANRDPRLRHFIIYNGNTAGVSNKVINTSLDIIHNNTDDNDGLNKIQTSTRTGYYMKKLLRQDVNLTPGSVSGQRHLKPRIRYTEIYLAYAEAANEAWGPTGTGAHNFSAYDVIKAIRQRAGITNGDAYLELAKNSQESMRELIRNERRLELCFEGFRFWDLRRWDKNLTETAKGVRIQSGQYQSIDVQNRVFQDFMKYGPIPYSEFVKYPALQQNNNW